MFFKITYRQWNCFLSSDTTDGKDGLGLKLEIAGPTFSSFNAMPAKTNKKALTHSLLEILPKTCFEASWVVFWLPLCYKELKLTTKPFTGRAFWSRCKLLACEVHAQKAKFWDFGFKSDTAVLAFTFRCLYSPLFSLFLPHLVGFILVGRVFRKAFRTLGLGERKGRWAMEQDFHGDFQVNVTWFFASFSGVLDWIVLILIWFERSLHSAQVSRQSCTWRLKLMTSQAVERTWICTGGYGQLRGEWVKVSAPWRNMFDILFITLQEHSVYGWRC